MPSWVNDGGTVRSVSKFWVNDGGTVREVTKLWANQSGTVRLVYENAFILDSSFAGYQLINGFGTYTNSNISDFIEAGGTLVIPSNFWLFSTSTSIAGLTINLNGITIINMGRITGRGASAQQAGGAAIRVTGSGAKFTNESGAFIAGGGGGGSGSAGGGGAGQSTINTASSNGSTTGSLSYGGLNRTNGSASGCSCAISVQGGTGGNQGGGGVPPSSFGGCGCLSCGSFYGGGCAQVNLSGSASNNPAQGGSILSASQNADGAGSNGGGGWGRSGESGGGAGGAAISGTYDSLTNNGTVYGST